MVDSDDSILEYFEKHLQNKAELEQKTAKKKKQDLTPKHKPFEQLIDVPLDDVLDIISQINGIAKWLYGQHS